MKSNSTNYYVKNIHSNKLIIIYEEHEQEYYNKNIEMHRKEIITTFNGHIVLDIFISSFKDITFYFHGHIWTDSSELFLYSISYRILPDISMCKMHSE